MKLPHVNLLDERNTVNDTEKLLRKLIIAINNQRHTATICFNEKRTIELIANEAEAHLAELQSMRDAKPEGI